MERRLPNQSKICKKNKILIGKSIFLILSVKLFLLKKDPADFFQELSEKMTNTIVATSLSIQRFAFFYTVYCLNHLKFRNLFFFIQALVTG